MLDPVATGDLPRLSLHGEGDESVRWTGAFVAYGGHGAIHSTTIVFEIEPGGRLGWHTDQTEETQYIIAGTETLRAVGFFAAAMFTQYFDDVMQPPNTHVLGTPNREGEWKS